MLAMGAAGGLSHAFGGQGKDQYKQISRLTPEQQSALKRILDSGIETTPLYQSGSNYLQQILSGDPSAMKAFEAPYMRQYEEQTIPGIAERFGGLGAGSSSGLNQTLAQAGTGLQSDLASLRANLQQGAATQALQYAQQPYSNLQNALGINAFENVMTPGRPSFLSSVFSGMAGGMSGMAGQSLMGGLGKMFGPSSPQIGMNPASQQSYYGHGGAGAYGSNWR